MQKRENNVEKKEYRKPQKLSDHTRSISEPQHKITENHKTMLQRHI